MEKSFGISAAFLGGGGILSLILSQQLLFIRAYLNDANNISAFFSGL
jgi:hypothetical protein